MTGSNALEAPRRELLVLAGAEALERFSYYGVRGLLVLFLTGSDASGGMGWTSESALRLLGWSIALVYALPVAGGWVGDRLFGRRTAVHVGAAILVGAYGLLAASAFLRSSPLMVASLVLIAAGTGLFKPNVTALVGGLFSRDDDAGREGGFLVFYLFMNLGVLFCGLVIGTLGESLAWHWGFFAAAVAMALAALIFARTRSGREPRVAACPAGHSSAPRRMSLSAGERAGIVAIGILGVFATLFWMGLEQTAGLLNLFAYERTQRDLLGLTIPATWFQSVNPLFVVVLAPCFAWLWTHLAGRGADIRVEWKFALGLVATGAAFAVMSLAAGSTRPGELANPAWLICAYLLLTVGELCIWTISLAAVTRLAPPRHVSSILGLWYLAIAIGGWLAGEIGALVSRMSVEDVFALLAGIFMAAAIALTAVAPLTGQLMSKARPTGDQA